MHLSRVVFMLSSLLVATVVQAEQQPVVTLKALNAHIANEAAMAAYQACSDRGFHVAVAVNDRQGRLLAFVRSPLSGPHTIKVSMRKAFTATTYRSPTSSMMNRTHLARSPGQEPGRDGSIPRWIRRRCFPSLRASRRRSAWLDGGSLRRAPATTRPPHPLRRSYWALQWSQRPCRVVRLRSAQ